MPKIGQPVNATGILPPRKEEAPARLFLGIDPGASGGISTVCGGVSKAYPMPPTEYEVFNLLLQAAYPTPTTRPVCIIEKVGGYVAGVSAPGSAMFNFGWGYGGLRMALIALKVPFLEITPRNWQKEFSLSKGKTESNGEYKNRMKALAQQIYPNIKVTLSIADALLICEYARRNSNLFAV